MLTVRPGPRRSEENHEIRRLELGTPADNRGSRRTEDSSIDGAMPHAGVDKSPADKYISSRSGGYGRGANLDKIKNNGMSGVVDVHFLNSRTHNTNKVDKKHQACVKEAAESGK